MSKSEYASFSDDEKMQMLKRFYIDLYSVYYGCQDNDFFFCFISCMSGQGCLTRKVNVLHCDCSFDDEKFVLSSQGVK